MCSYFYYTFVVYSLPIRLVGISLLWLSLIDSAFEADCIQKVLCVQYRKYKEGIFIQLLR